MKTGARPLFATVIGVQSDSVAAALQRTAIFGVPPDSALRELAQGCLQRTYGRDQFLRY
jgi:hypothetical protein